MREPRGVGVQTGPVENLKAIGFLTNTGQDPLESHKATQSALNAGPS